MFRICGRPRGVTKSLIYEVHKKFGVRGNVSHRPVPHVTLYGPFRARYVKPVIRAIVDSARSFGPFSYDIDNFGWFDKKTGVFSSKKHAIYLKINASPEMKKFRTALYKRLSPVTVPKDPKIEEDPFKFHATIALKDVNAKFEDIWKHLSDRGVGVSGKFAGITLLRDGKILREYNLNRGVLLDRHQALQRRCLSY